MKKGLIIFALLFLVGSVFSTNYTFQQKQELIDNVIAVDYALGENKNIKRLMITYSFKFLSVYYGGFLSDFFKDVSVLFDGIIKQEEHRNDSGDNSDIFLFMHYWGDLDREGAYEMAKPVGEIRRICKEKGFLDYRECMISKLDENKYGDIIEDFKEDKKFAKYFEYTYSFVDQHEYSPGARSIFLSLDGSDYIGLEIPENLQQYFSWYMAEGVIENNIYNGSSGPGGYGFVFRVERRNGLDYIYVKVADGGGSGESVYIVLVYDNSEWILITVGNYGGTISLNSNLFGVDCGKLDNYTFLGLQEQRYTTYCLNLSDNSNFPRVLMDSYLSNDSFEIDSLIEQFNAFLIPIF